MAPPEIVNLCADSRRAVCIASVPVGAAGCSVGGDGPVFGGFVA